MSTPYIHFIYGLCIMFNFLMSWLFIRKNKEFLSRLVATFMGLVGLQCIKDLILIYSGVDPSPYIWKVTTVSDMIAVPFYTFILMELCKPGTLTLKTMIIHELPFVLFTTLYIITDYTPLYYITVGWAIFYGTAYAIWAVFAIPKYHRLLKQRFSYVENINLNWLRNILFSFFAILWLWFADCIIVNINVEIAYMLGTLIFWMLICYFIYKHESVIDEIHEAAPTPCEEHETTEAATDDNDLTDNHDFSELELRIRHLFEEEKIYLNPQLKLSDVATLSGSNRTYISRAFNNNHGKSFFEYVNNYRVKYAMELLTTTSERIEIIAEKSGFSSRQSFQRVFSKIVGCTPGAYRTEQNR